MTSDINTLMNDLKTGFRRIEINQTKFEDNKRKNMDRYFQQVLNQKKQKYYEELMLAQSENSRSSTVSQLVNRVQTLKRHVMRTGKVSADIKSFTAGESKRGKINFTDAGFPIHDYIREMREDREK